MYTYKALVTHVVDADTVDVDIDLGFGVWRRKVRIRLGRINAYETRLVKGTTPEMKEKGLEGKQYVKNLILDKEITVITTEKGKYGRWIGEILVPGFGEDKVNLNDFLVELGYAVYHSY